MAESIDGFSDLAIVLENFGRKVMDESVKRRALEAGAEPIVSRAKRVAAQHKRTGTLESGIISAYDEKGSTMDIGWSKDAFYGRILDNGFNHTRGKHIQIEHLKASYEAEKENAMNAMLEVYKKELS